jgi:putative ABC transport system permease protein
MSDLTIFCAGVTVVVLVFGAVVLLTFPKLYQLIFRNLRRNLLRTLLTSAAIVALVIMITMILTVVADLDRATEEQSQDIKLIVTERWQLPSQMPSTHANYLNPGHPLALPGIKKLVAEGKMSDKDFMTWSFYGGTTDPKRITLETMVFMFCMNPDHIKPMMDDLQDTPDEVIAALKADPRNVILGKDRLEKLNLKVGETFKLTSINYQGIDLDFRIVGEIPGNRWSLLGIMNVKYFDNAFDDYKSKTGKRHPLDNRRLNLVWLRVRDKDAVTRIADEIEKAPEFSDRPVKCETASSGIAAFLDAYRDILWIMKVPLPLFLFASISLVIASAIAITVRERRTEMAVLKVLGFRPVQILVLVIGEALLVGGSSGLGATLGCYAIINWVFGGIPFPIAFFPAFTVPWDAFFWGFAIGVGAGFLGSFMPAWWARSVKVSEVFAKVA